MGYMSSLGSSAMVRLLRWNIPGPRTPASLDRVIVPLEDAHLHSYAARHGGAGGSAEQDDDDDAEGGGAPEAKSSHEETGMLEMSVSEYSIEGLRREIRKGSRGPLTEYERASIAPILRGLREESGRKG